MAALLFLAGLALLVVGAEAVVRSGSRLAERLQVPPIVIGMTVVSLGTSLPELAIGVNAVRSGAPGLAVGNIVGTNLVNTLLVLGIAALLRPIVFTRRTLRFDLPASAAAALLLLVVARDGELGLVDGLLLTGFGLGYLVAVVASGRRTARAVDDPAGDAGGPATAPAGGGSGVVPQALVLVVGLGAILVGADVLVEGASVVAGDLGMSDALVGLTIVAIGTSAPELATVVVATVRGDRAIALGNLMGSNVFNIALVLGPTVVVAPAAVPVPDDVLRGDLLLMVVAALACLPAFWTRSLLSRIEGAAFVGAYVAYLAHLLSSTR